MMIRFALVVLSFMAALNHATAGLFAQASQGGAESVMDKNRILIQLSESPRSHYGKVPYDKQSKPQQVFSAVWGLEAQVNNGGFAQYFDSWEGEVAVDAAAALRAIGAPRAAEIVAKAVAAFPGGTPPRDQDARQRLLGAASSDVRAVWERLDQQFLKYPDDLISLLYAWVAAHPKEFGDIQ
jgi:hypothetical protein